MNMKRYGFTVFIWLASMAPGRTRADVGERPAPGMLCSDHAPQPPADHHKVKDKVIFEEITQGVFPGALFPLDYAVDGEVTSSGLYFDDAGRVMSARAAIAILENHASSQDLILAWRSNTEAESQARSSTAAGVMGVAMAGDAATAESSVAKISSAQQNLDRLEGGAESAFASAVCAYNAGQAARRARSGGAR